ncbi:MAG: hypothetical protein ACOY3P_01720 [Planctomycetota bacterium]
MAISSTTQFRRSGQRDDRRRRLLTEETPTLPRARGRARPGHMPGRKSERYGDAEFLDDPLRVIDLVPRGPLGHLGVLVFGLAAIAGLVALHLLLVPESVDVPVWANAFHLAAEGSLATWFTALVWLGAGMVALLVFSVRRYRTDDYHGRYRIWLWAAACWALLATDEAASLHESFQACMTKVSGTALGSGAVWWIGVYGFVLGSLGIRLVLDMRECWLSTAIFVLAGGTLASDVVLRIALDGPQFSAVAVVLVQSAEMLGGLLLLASMLLHARHVLLDAEGLLTRKESSVAASTRASHGRRRSDLDTPAAVTQESAAAEGDRTDRAVHDDSDEQDRTDFDRSEDDGHHDAFEDDVIFEEAEDNDESASKTNPAPVTGAAVGSSGWLRADPPHPSPSPPARKLSGAQRRKAKRAAAKAAKTTAVADDAAGHSRPADARGSATPAAIPATRDKLSKAERKALKQRLIKERLQREQKQRSKW